LRTVEIRTDLARFDWTRSRNSGSVRAGLLCTWDSPGVVDLVGADS